MVNNPRKLDDSSITSLDFGNLFSNELKIMQRNKMTFRWMQVKSHKSQFCATMIKHIKQSAKPCNEPPNDKILGNKQKAPQSAYYQTLSLKLQR